MPRRSSFLILCEPLLRIQIPMQRSRIIATLGLIIALSACESTKQTLIETDQDLQAFFGTDKTNQPAHGHETPSYVEDEELKERGETKKDEGEGAARGVAHEPDVQATLSVSSTTTRPSARVIATAARQECVPYARSVSSVSIRGDAWTWWRSAAERYGRDSRPAVGSILVLKRTSRLRYGHVALVSRVLNSREILVDHANWLNRGHIHQSTLVKDVSPNNNWSAVRVWYTPGNTLGKRTYAAYGFIHPHQARALRLRQPRMQGPDVRALQETLVNNGFVVVVDGIFGPGTRDALAVYQGRNGLTQDGIAGPSTRASLGI